MDEFIEMDDTREVIKNRLQIFRRSIIGVWDNNGEAKDTISEINSGK